LSVCGSRNQLTHTMKNPTLENLAYRTLIYRNINDKRPKEYSSYAYLFNLEIVLQLIINTSQNIKSTKNLVNKVKTNNSDDKGSAYTSCYIIANADDQNAPPTEQTSVFLGTSRDPPRQQKPISDNIYSIP
jgi:hypothetical protein